MTEQDFIDKYGDENIYLAAEVPPMLRLSLSQVYALIDEGILLVIMDPETNKKRMPIRVYRSSILKYLVPPDEETAGDPGKGGQ